MSNTCVNSIGTKLEEKFTYQDVKDVSMYMTFTFDSNAILEI